MVVSPLVTDKKRKLFPGKSPRLANQELAHENSCGIRVATKSSVKLPAVLHKAASKRPPKWKAQT